MKRNTYNTRRTLSSEGIRRIRALAVVLTILALPVLIDSVLGYMSSDSSSPFRGNEGESLSESLHVGGANGSPAVVLDRIEAMSFSGIATDQDVLSSEVSIPLQAENVRHDPATSIFSFELEGQPYEVLDNLATQWATQGWARVSFGGLPGATFIKEEGEYQWMLVTCTQVGAQVCVVGNLQGS